MYSSTFSISVLGIGSPLQSATKEYQRSHTKLFDAIYEVQNVAQFTLQYMGQEYDHSKIQETDNKL